MITVIILVREELSGGTLNGEEVHLLQAHSLVLMSDRSEDNPMVPACESPGTNASATRTSIPCCMHHPSATAYAYRKKTHE